MIISMDLRRHSRKFTLQNWAILLCFNLCAILPLCAQQALSVSQSLEKSIGKTSAVAVVLDASTGRLLGVIRPHQAALLLTTPGSTLKPLFLAYALQHGKVQADTRFLCRRTLRIGAHSLDCIHPMAGSTFDAEQALAYSCNSYFANLSQRLTPQDAVSALALYGIGEPTHLFVEEASPILRKPESPDETALFVLGVDGVAITTAQLAVAYRRLSLQLAATSQDSTLSAISRGLEDSVAYGMSHNAAVAGLRIAGKTGTANSPGEPWTHGWFAGFAPADHPRIVIAIYVPRGSGSDAAHLAQEFFSAYKEALR